MMNTRTKCKVRIQTLNTMLGRPFDGPLSLELRKDGVRFNMVELYENGHERPWNQEPLSLEGMNVFIDGVIAGFALRTEHFCQDMLVKELAKIPNVQVGPLYSDTNRNLLRAAISKDANDQSGTMRPADIASMENAVNFGARGDAESGPRGADHMFVTFTDGQGAYNEGGNESNDAKCEHELVFQHPGLFRNDIYKCAKCGKEESRRWDNRY